MKNFTKRLTALLLIILTLISITACSGMTPSYTINGGDVNEITINQEGEPLTAGATKAMLSAVSILTDRASGSGVIYKMNDTRTEAYVVTNYHVIYTAGYGVSKNIYLYLYGMESEDYGIKASFVGGSMNYDLAVLKVENSDILAKSSAVPADFADSDEVKILSTVIAIGNARGNGLSATVGHINVESEYIALLGSDDRTPITLRVMRTDAAVNPGNSGGGLFNTRGEVIGIVNAKSTDEDVDNMGYAIPSNVAKNIVDNIIYYCDGTDKTCVYRCLLGITVESKNLRTEYNVETQNIDILEDIIISAVEKGSAADGKFMVGDKINSIKIADKSEEIHRRHTLIDFMLMARPGSVITINVTRGGSNLDIVITATENMLEAYV